MTGLPYFTDDGATLWHGDALAVLAGMPDGSVDCIVTSPPYFGLRDYGTAGTDWPAMSYAPMHGLPHVDVPAMTCPLGLEPTPAAFVAHLVLIFREARRVLADDGTLWLNLAPAARGARPRSPRRPRTGPPPTTAGPRASITTPSCGSPTPPTPSLIFVKGSPNRAARRIEGGST